MWNGFNTADYEGMIAEVIKYPGKDQEMIRGYYSRPLGVEKAPGIVLIPHMPGWDEWLRECARRFTAHGYSVLVPNIYERFGHATPAEISMKAREAGGVTDDSVMGDVQGAINFLRNQMNSNDKVGVIGMCSGGRHTFLAACTCEGIDAAVDCWGGGLKKNPERTMPGHTMDGFSMVQDLSCPLLGIFGNDDMMPTPEEVNETEELLKKYEKDYTFYRYDGAGHGFWYYDRPMYRQEQAMDSFNKVIDFFDEKLK